MKPSNDEQVKMILKKLAEDLDNDVTEVSVVTGLHVSTVRKLLNNTAAGTSKVLSRLKRSMGMSPTRSRDLAKDIYTRDGLERLR